MALVLPTAPGKYDQKNEQDTRSRIVTEDANNLKKNTRIYLGSGSIVLKSPNGTQWEMSVDNTGALIMTSL